jgi:hypothetical protein
MINNKTIEPRDNTPHRQRSMLEVGTETDYKATYNIKSIYGGSRTSAY